MSQLNKKIQFMKLRGNGRRPSNWPLDGAGIPLRITRLFPMKLKEVSFDTKKQESDVVCLTEMMSLFDCFRDNDFAVTHCENQVKALKSCYSNFKGR